MKRFILAAVLVICAGTAIQAQVPIYDMKGLDEARHAYQKGNKTMVKIINSLKEEAEKYLNTADVFVTEKKIVPPSKDPRDYMSRAPYWWADPDKPDGLPYIRRDGERNPEVNLYLEKKNKAVMSDGAVILALAYYFTGDEKYATKCASFVRSWFLDPVKGMNPNMTYGQGIPGRTLGRPAGIIDAAGMVTAFAATQLIEGSASWSDADKEGLADWARAFCYWLKHSTIGIGESKTVNNHGLWYESTKLSCMCLYETPENIRKEAEECLLPRIGVQVAEDGSLPEELVRTRALHYSTFALEAMVSSGRICRNVGLDIWNYTAENGRNLEMAVEFMVPYYLAPETWPYPQINEFEQCRGIAMMYFAGKTLGRKDWVRLAKKTGYTNPHADINSIINYKIAK